MKRISLTLALLSLALVAPALFGQKQEGPPDAATMAQRHVQHLTTLLNLTPEQQQQALTIFSNQPNLESEHQSMRSAHQALETAITNNDANGITQAANLIGSMMAQNIANQAKAHAALYQILNTDQRAKLKELGPEDHFFFHAGPGIMIHHAGPL
jgi:Spy/CpxP family protein refolding chaperone